MCTRIPAAGYSGRGRSLGYRVSLPEPPPSVLPGGTVADGGAPEDVCTGWGAAVLGGTAGCGRGAPAGGGDAPPGEGADPGSDPGAGTGALGSLTSSATVAMTPFAFCSTSRA